MRRRKRLRLQPLNGISAGDSIDTGGLWTPPRDIALAGLRNFYVSAAGSDSADGLTETTPWRTVSKVNAQVFQPGDWVHWRRGDTWSAGTRLTMSQAGTSANPIVLDAYGSGARPIFDGNGTITDVVWLSGAWTKVRNLQVQGATFYGLHVRAPDCTVGAVGQGNIWTHNGIGCLVNGSVGAHRAKVLGNSGVQNDRMVVNTPGGDDDYGAQAIQLVGGPQDVEVAYNYFSGNIAASFDYGWDGTSVEIFGAVRANIHHNLSENDFVFCELGQAGTADNIVHHNLVVLTAALGSGCYFIVTRGQGDAFGPVLNTQVYHNSVYMTGPGSHFGWWGGGTIDSSILTVRNNIISIAAGTIGNKGAAGVSDYNCYSTTGSRGFTLGTHDKVQNPLFVSAADLHLQNGSPAIDAGTNLGYTTDYDGVARPQGAGFDMGAYERA